MRNQEATLDLEHLKMFSGSGLIEISNIVPPKDLIIDCEPPHIARDNSVIKEELSIYEEESKFPQSTKNYKL